jgi:hypothetical protein
MTNGRWMFVCSFVRYLPVRYDEAVVFMKSFSPNHAFMLKLTYSTSLPAGWDEFVRDGSSDPSVI